MVADVFSIIPLLLSSVADFLMLEAIRPLWACIICCFAVSCFLRLTRI